MIPVCKHSPTQDQNPDQTPRSPAFMLQIQITWPQAPPPSSGDNEVRAASLCPRYANNPTSETHCQLRSALTKTETLGSVYRKELGEETTAGGTEATKRDDSDQRRSEADAFDRTNNSGLSEVIKSAH